MGDCNLTLTYSCPKTCKYSYSSWCPTCEIHSPRRRSRSETNEPRIECRKKCKDMKTFTPRKYHRSREYENMELEYDVKDGWSQTKDNWCESKDNRVECCRIRSNLCELPTSYISNNCQSMTTKLSSDTSDYVVKSKPLFNDINQLSSVQKEYKPIVMDNKLSPNKIDVLRPHYRLDQRLSSPRHSALPKTRTSPFHIKNELFRDNQNCDDYKNCREYCTLVDLKHHNIQDRSMCYDTSTYFNTGELDSFNLHDKYNTEMNRLKENLVTLKNSSPSIEKSPSDCNRFIQQMLEKYSDIPEPLVAKPYELKVKKPKEKQMLSPTAKQRSRISLKTRPAGAKFSNVKLRRNRPKVSSTPCLTQANTERVSPKKYQRCENLSDEENLQVIRDILHRTLAPKPQSIVQRPVPFRKIGKLDFTTPNLERKVEPTKLKLTDKIVKTARDLKGPKKPSQETKDQEQSLGRSLSKILNDSTNATQTKSGALIKLKKCIQDETTTCTRLKELLGETLLKIDEKSRLLFEKNEQFLKTPASCCNTKGKTCTHLREVLNEYLFQRNIVVENKIEDDPQTQKDLVKRKILNEPNHDVNEGYRSEDDNEPEADLDEADGGSEVSNAESVEDKKDESEETEISLNETGSGDACREWPVRQSLFPYIPPYISFSAHSAEHPTKFPLGGRFFKWKLTTITPILVRQTLTNSGFALVKSEFSRESNQWLGTWGKHMKSPMFRTLKETQKINHFPGTFQLGRKDRLWRNFQRLINKFGHKEFGFIPHTYVLPQELQLLKQNWEYKNGSGGEMWIIKPPASARGVGIKVINKWSQLPKKTSLVVQKYIAKPYLINGSKFDLRLYVLVTSFHPLRIYLYPDGLARFASAKYSEESKDLKDRYRHLTNYSINKLSDQYTANEDANSCQGHKWTISKLMEYLQERGVNSSLLWKNLQQLVIKTMISAEAPITQLCEEHMNSLYNCYELFGVDVLLDEDLKPWLLEVNISPSLHSASPLDAHVKGPLVQTLFDMAQFHLPSRITKESQETPGGFVGKIYTTGLMKTERLKHIEYEQYESRSDYLEDILTKLTGDDVRQLTRAEDEFVAKGNFERIFPTENTHKYLQFMEPRYYNRLFDAWETKYSANRKEGIKLLKSLCEKKVHLKAAPSSRLKKNLPSTIPGDVKVQQSKEVQNRPLEEILRTASITNDVTIVCAN